MDAKGAAAVLQEAFEVQERITRQRKALRAEEALLKNLLLQLEKENVGRAGDYERKREVVRRAVIVLEHFRARWPEVFARIAKVTVKDAREAEIPEAELMEACDTTEQVSWKIIFSAREARYFYRHLFYLFQWKPARCGCPGLCYLAFFRPRPFCSSLAAQGWRHPMLPISPKPVGIFTYYS